MNVNFTVCLLENLSRFKLQKQSNRFNPETGMESGKKNSFLRTGGVLTERGGLETGIRIGRRQNKPDSDGDTARAGTGGKAFPKAPGRLLPLGEY